MLANVTNQLYEYGIILTVKNNIKSNTLFKKEIKIMY